MTIEQPDIVDLISVNQAANEVVLTISDHLEWNGDDEHLLLLQQKLNGYLAFVESGEIFESYPKAKGLAIVISVACKYPLSQHAKDFFNSAAAIIEGAGFRLSYQVLGDD